MLEINGKLYQTGNGTPITAKKILVALCKSGEARGQILKGRAFINNGNDKLLEGDLRPNKDYYSSFNEIGYMNPDVILQNSRKELRFLYSIN